MSPFLPFDIIELIIDIIGPGDIDLLKELALVSHFFLQICRKHVFAAIDLYDACPRRPASSKQGFIKLLKNNPGIVEYIRKLTYNVSHNPDNSQLSPILPNFLRTISHLDCLMITSPYGVSWDWNLLDPSLESALLSLMHLPTINHIGLAYISNFPLSGLTPSPCLNLNWLEILCVDFTMPLEGDSHTESIHLEVPRIHRLSTAFSTPTTKELLHAKGRDGRPAFNFRDLKQLSIPFCYFEDFRPLLQYAEQLEELRMEDGVGGYTGLHNLIYPSARTLRFLSVPFGYTGHISLEGLCAVFERMAGHYLLEVLEFRVDVGDCEPKDTLGSIIQKLEEVLVKPGWSTLKQVSFLVSSESWVGSGAQSRDALQYILEKHLSRLSKHESITFNYLVYVEDLKCVHEHGHLRNIFTSRTSGFWKFRQFASSAVRWVTRFPKKRHRGGGLL